MARSSALRIATRNSPLAMWQANHVAAMLRSADDSLTIEFVDTATFADKRLDLPISELGGKGAFSKEIQRLVIDDAADLAVHSAKDLQAVTPDALVVAAFPERGDPRDMLVGTRLNELPESAVVATGSNRRRVQLAQLRPDLRFMGLRGNIATRLGKAGDFDAIVMAAAAVDRLELDLPNIDMLAPDVMVPQVGQGALAVECKADDEELIEVLSAIDHEPTRQLVTAERGFLIELGGDCDLPAGAHATGIGGEITLTAVLASPDETQLARTTVRAAPGSSGVADVSALGARAAVGLRRELGLT